MSEHLSTHRHFNPSPSSSRSELSSLNLPTAGCELLAGRPHHPATDQLSANVFHDARAIIRAGQGTFEDRR